jgi:hypothetical protein
MRDFMRQRRDHKLRELGGSGYFGFHAIKRCPLSDQGFLNLSGRASDKRAKAAREGSANR